MGRKRFSGASASRTGGPDDVAHFQFGINTGHDPAHGHRCEGRNTAKRLKARRRSTRPHTDLGHEGGESRRVPRASRGPNCPGWGWEAERSRRRGAVSWGTKVTIAA